MLMVILGALLPVFGLILLGFGCGRSQLLGDRAFEVLNRFVIMITLPVLTFRTLATMDPADLAVPSMLGAVLGGAFITYALGFHIERAFGRSRAEANIAGLSSSFSNTGFVGLPVATLAFGPAVLGPVAVTMALYAAVVFGVAVLLSELVSDADHGLRESGLRACRAILKTPLIIMSVAGAIWAIIGLPMTGPMDIFLQTLAGATAPCALVAIGLFISLPRQSAAPAPITRVVVLKLLVHPLITALLLFILPPMPPMWASMAILMAAMPAGASSFVLAGGAGRWAMELSAWAVTLTTSLAALTLVPILWIIGTR